jgi:hypothetical protein
LNCSLAGRLFLPLVGLFPGAFGPRDSAEIWNPPVTLVHCFCVTMITTFAEFGTPNPEVDAVVVTLDFGGFTHLFVLLFLPV